MGFRLVEGYTDGNVVHIKPEGDVRRYDLFDKEDRIRVKRLVVSAKILKDGYEYIGDALAMLGLIQDGSFVIVQVQEGEILIIDSTCDALLWTLKPVA